MNHKRYPLAYLLEVVMPLNLVIVRDEEPGVTVHGCEAGCDWVIELYAGEGRTVAVSYFQNHENPFFIECEGFGEDGRYESYDSQQVSLRMADLGEAIQLLREIDVAARTEIRRVV